MIIIIKKDNSTHSETQKTFRKSWAREQKGLSYFAFPVVKKNESGTCSATPIPPSVEKRMTHLECSPAPATAGPPFAWFYTQSCLVSCIRVQIQLPSFATYFWCCHPFPNRCIWHFLKASASEAHTKTSHLSAAKSLQLTRDRQTQRKSQDTVYPVVTSPHTRRLSHLPCNLYYSFFPVKRENKG